MLNEAHSALAFLGLERGVRFEHEAVSEPEIRELVDRLMRQEAAPLVAAGAGQDLDAYAEDLLERISRSRLQHGFSQIARDGSQRSRSIGWKRWRPPRTRAASAERSCVRLDRTCGMRGATMAKWTICSPNRSRACGSAEAKAVSTISPDPTLMIVLPLPQRVADDQASSLIMAR